MISNIVRGMHMHASLRKKNCLKINNIFIDVSKLPLKCIVCLTDGEMRNWR